MSSSNERRRHINIAYQNERFIEGYYKYESEWMRASIVPIEIDGSYLFEYVGRLRLIDALDYAIQFCDGLVFANRELGILHKNINPNSALLVSGIIKVILDKNVEQISTDELNRSDIDVSQKLGFYSYIAPEQFPEIIQNRFNYTKRDITIRSSIYSFGATFYEVLTGNPPFSNVEQVFMNDPVKPSNFNPSMPEKLDSLLMRCLEKDPNDRYGNFSDLMESIIDIYNALPSVCTKNEKYIMIEERKRSTEKFVITPMEPTSEYVFLCPSCNKKISIDNKPIRWLAMSCPLCGYTIHRTYLAYDRDYFRD